jgi:phage terminase large subunit GpA-like protein
MLTAYVVPFERAIASGEHSRVVAVFGTQTGKALSLDTPLPTPAGWLTMGEVGPRDVLFDERGQPTKVVAISPVMVGHDCYRVSFSDGTSIVADADHRWAVQPSRGQGRLINRIRSTRQLAEWEGRNLAIPVAEPLALPDIPLPIQPYVLGLWLGDGNSSSGNMTCGDGDYQEVLGLLKAEGINVRAKRYRTAWSLILDPLPPAPDRAAHNREYQRQYFRREHYGEAMTLIPLTSQRAATMYSRLASLGLIGEKAIPPAYLRASAAQRVALLQGLMDADGYCGQNGSCEFCSTNVGLAQGALELIRSLGLKPTITIGVARLNGREIGLKYRVHFTAYAETPVFRLGRKLARQRSIADPRSRPTEAGRRFIVSVEKVPSVPVKCVAVDSASHLYLAGEGMTPTHNTEALLDCIGERLDQQPAPIIYVGPTEKFVREQFEPRVIELLNSAETLSAKVARGKRSTKTRKLVAGVPLRLIHAGSSSDLKSSPASLALIDEYVQMLGSVQGQGSVLELAEARGETYADFVTAVVSTPTLGIADVERDRETGLEFWRVQPTEDIECPIWRLWQAGTRHHWCWQCPACEEWFVPRLRQLRWEGYPGGAPVIARRRSWMECPSCGARITEEDKTPLNLAGRYVSPGETIDRAGNVSGQGIEASAISFWASGLCSPFRTFGQRAESYLLALESGEQEVRTMVNRFGELFAPKGTETPEWAEVMACRADYDLILRAGEPTGARLPTGVLFVTMTVDVQKNSLVYLIRGWGPRATSWLLAYGELLGPTNEWDVWDALSDLMYTPIGGKRIRLCLIDSGFRPDKTWLVPENMVYDFCYRHRRLCHPAKGSSSPLQDPVRISSKEVNPTGRKSKYALQLYRIDTNQAKSWVHERVRWPGDSWGAWHLPGDVSEDYARQIVSEARVKTKEGKPQWLRRSRRNHYLDCEAMSYIAGWVLHAHRVAPHVTKAKSPLQDDGTFDRPPPMVDPTEEPPAGFQKVVNRGARSGKSRVIPPSF